MESIASIDSLSIQLTNTQPYQEQINKFYKDNNLMFFKRELDNVNINQYRFTTQSDTRTNLFYSNHSGNKFNPNTYTTINFAGLMTHKNKKDACRANILHKFIQLLPKIAIERKLTKLDLAFDMLVPNDNSIEKFLPIKIGQRTAINNPFNFFDTTLYVEDQSISKPSQKAYLYNKSGKENISKKTIIRFEISIRNLKNVDNNYEAIIEHINKILSRYKLYYFNSKANCNIIKRKYRDNITKSKRENFPGALEKLTKDLGAEEIDLSISNEVAALIKQFFHKESNPIKHEGKIPTYIKKLSRKKKTIPAIKNKKILIHHIPKQKMFQDINRPKKSILNLKIKINLIPINPLILKVFHYQNKAPPIINLYLHPYSVSHYHSII